MFSLIHCVSVRHTEAVRNIIQLFLQYKSSVQYVNYLYALNRLTASVKTCSIDYSEHTMTNFFSTESDWTKLNMQQWGHVTMKDTAVLHVQNYIYSQREREREFIFVSCNMCHNNHMRNRNLMKQRRTINTYSPPTLYPRQAFWSQYPAGPGGPTGPGIPGLPGLPGLPGRPDGPGLPVLPSPGGPVAHQETDTSASCFIFYRVKWLRCP